jgi:hypothetical protein
MVMQGAMTADERLAEVAGDRQRVRVEPNNHITLFLLFEVSGKRFDLFPQQQPSDNKVCLISIRCGRDPSGKFQIDS